MASRIHQRLLKITLDDAAGCVKRAKTSAGREAQLEHRRTIAELHRQREELTAAIPQDRTGARGCDEGICLTSLRQRTKDIDEAIHATDACLETLLHESHPAASRPSAITQPTVPAAFTIAVSQLPAYMGSTPAFPALSMATSTTASVAMQRLAPSWGSPPPPWPLCYPWPYTSLGWR